VKRSTPILMILLLLGIALAGCPKKAPTNAYKKAMDALKRARAARASDCAKDELRSAENLMARAKKYMDQGKYEKAKTAFDAARKQAEKAKEEAEINKKDCLKKLNPPKTRALPTPPTIVTAPGENTTDNRQSLQTIYFDFNRSQLTEKAKGILTRHADWLNKHPSAKLEISGHCDQRGSVEYNLALGERRAIKVKQFLLNLGVSNSRMSVVSYGHQKPADPRLNAAAFAKNRRAEFKVSK